MAAIGGAVLGMFGVETAGAAAIAAEAGAGAAAGFGAAAAGTSVATGLTLGEAIGATAAGIGGSSLVQGAGQAVGSAAVSSLLAPKMPALPKPTPMPDPQAQEAARKKSLLEQTARRGRASTILTDSASDKLGG